jgi:hypothetical protein
VFRWKATDILGEVSSPSSSWLLAWLILWPWRWRRHVPPKHLLTFSRLHGVISQKIELFKITKVPAKNIGDKNKIMSFLFSSASVWAGRAQLILRLGYRLNSGMIRVWFVTRTSDFLFSRVFILALGPTDYCENGIEGPSPEIRQPGREGDHSHSSSAVFLNLCQTLAR